MDDDKRIETPAFAPIVLLTPADENDDGLGPRISVPVEFWDLCQLALKLARVVKDDRRDPESARIFCDFVNADTEFLARHARRKIHVVKG